MYSFLFTYHLHTSICHLSKQVSLNPWYVLGTVRGGWNISVSWIGKHSFSCGAHVLVRKADEKMAQEAKPPLPEPGRTSTGLSSVQFSSLPQLCLTLCGPTGYSMLDFPVHHQPPELTQTCVHLVGDAIQSHPPSPSPPTFYLSQHQGLFQWVNFSHQVAKVLIGALASVLPRNIQDWLPLGLTGLISLQFKELSRVFSSTTVQTHQFFGTQLSLWSNSHIHTWPLETK